VVLPQKVAGCPAVPGGIVPLYRLIDREKGVMWLGPCETPDGFCLRRLRRGGCAILLAGERLTGLSPLGRLRGVRGRPCSSPQRG